MGGPGGVGTGGSFGENPYAGANTGTMMALGTLANPQPNMLAMGSNTLMPYHKRATANYPSQSATLLRSSNHSYNGAFQVSTLTMLSYPNLTFSSCKKNAKKYFWHFFSCKKRFLGFFKMSKIGKIKKKFL